VHIGYELCELGRVSLAFYLLGPQLVNNFVELFRPDDVLLVTNASDDPILDDLEFGVFGLLVQLLVRLFLGFILRGILNNCLCHLLVEAQVIVMRTRLAFATDVWQFFVYNNLVQLWFLATLADHLLLYELVQIALHLYTFE